MKMDRKSFNFLNFFNFFNFFIEFSRSGLQNNREMKTTASWKLSWAWASDPENERNEDYRLW